MDWHLSGMAPRRMTTPRLCGNGCLTALDVPRELQVKHYMFNSIYVFGNKEIRFCNLWKKISFKLTAYQCRHHCNKRNIVFVPVDLIGRFFWRSWASYLIPQSLLTGRQILFMVNLWEFLSKSSTKIFSHRQPLKLSMDQSEVSGFPAWCICCAFFHIDLVWWKWTQDSSLTKFYRFSLSQHNN